VENPGASLIHTITIGQTPAKVTPHMDGRKRDIAKVDDVAGQERAFHVKANNPLTVLIFHVNKILSSLKLSR